MYQVHSRGTSADATQMAKPDATDADAGEEARGRRNLNP